MGKLINHKTNLQGGEDTSWGSYISSYNFNNVLLFVWHKILNV